MPRDPEVQEAINAVVAEVLHDARSALDELGMQIAGLDMGSVQLTKDARKALIDAIVRELKAGSDNL